MRIGCYNDSNSQRKALWYIMIDILIAGLGEDIHIIDNQNNFIISNIIIHQLRVLGLEVIIANLQSVTEVNSNFVFLQF